MNDTPRTDAEVGVHIGNPNHALVYAKFARSLERDLNAAVEARDFWVEETSKALELYAAKCLELNEAQRIAQTPAPDTPKQ